MSPSHCVPSTTLNFRSSWCSSPGEFRADCMRGKELYQLTCFCSWYSSAIYLYFIFCGARSGLKLHVHQACHKQTDSQTPYRNGILSSHEDKCLYLSLNKIKMAYIDILNKVFSQIGFIGFVVCFLFNGVNKFYSIARVP